jgi:phage terminase large subunit-like protein
VTLAAAVLLGAANVRAQIPDASQPPGSELTVSLMTMGVGERVWERFGHNAILVEDHARGTSKAYNYGLFDFNQQNFILRFVQGRMVYWMQGFDLQPTLQVYVRTNRTVWVQQLGLTPAERVALRDFLEWNERPEHRFYRYDYYRDNCSTRVRDALDRVLGGRIRAATDTIATGRSYRFHTSRLVASELPLYTALLLALGQPVDRPLTAWEEMFLPLELRDWIRHVTVVDDSGRTVPLVKSERTLFQGTEPAERAAPPDWVRGFLTVGLALGLLLWGLGHRGVASARARTWFAWVAGGWTLLAGIVGGLLAFLWAFTDHAAAYRNENLFQVNLLVLPLAVAAPALARGSAGARSPARWFSALVAAASLAGLVLKVSPAFDQHNAEMLALFVPANLGLALGISALASDLRG